MITHEQYTLREIDGRWISVFFQYNKISMSYGETEAEAIASCWDVMERAKLTPFYLILDQEDHMIVGPVLQKEICKLLDISLEDFNRAISEGAKGLPEL